ncbi:oxidoreductase-like domain-containing protein 1 [Pollicipes pollicipes]|uniref:oxidoreductase-like domain-containing protein 1 n=1 Tax=Pollicipes pollicipes TaxID=41117 RepID=UPI0018856DC1|nr:oxidoreductase-like domain-containing protein 1 [Pollicipes pollicipes]
MEGSGDSDATSSDGESSSGESVELLENLSALAEAVDAPPPEQPTICCMSGCANCVWIEYAERLAAHYRDGGEAGRRAIEANVTDPSLKAFLLLELRTR